LKGYIVKYDDYVEQLEDNIARVEEIDAMAEITEELKAEQDTLIEAQEGLKAKITRAAEQVKTGNFLKEAKANPPVEKRIVKAASIAKAAPSIIDTTKIPATAKRALGRLMSFKGDNAELQAYRFGQWFMGSVGIQSSIQYCQNAGIPLMAVHNEDTNTQGGYLVPEEFGTDLIRLVLEYGVFRANTNVVPMMSDTRTDPRRTGGLTGYWVGESSAGTESTAAWDQVRLVAKKLMVLTRVTNELSADAAISIGDQLMDEIALVYANEEDDAGFNGDGTSTYGGITGARQSLSDAAGTPTTTSAGGIIVSANNTYAEITLAELHSVVSLCPTYARGNAKWYCSPIFNDTVLQKLQTAAGGNTTINIAAGGQDRMLGYPVELTEVMPTAAANSQIPLLFGDLRKASKLGDRQQRTIATSDSAVIGGESVFERDQLAIRATERIDINVHDVGDSSDAGPIVGLQLLNS
jgi:HK97 family phage major capsid protein